MQINIQDDAENWHRWGTLIRSWACGTGTLPADTTELKAQMDSAGVAGSIPGPARTVTFVAYNGNPGPLVIPLPTCQMITDDENRLANIATSTPGHRQYPLPAFYAVAFGGTPKVDLSADEMLAFGRRRLGEYVIEECQ